MEELNMRKGEVVASQTTAENAVKMLRQGITSIRVMLSRWWRNVLTNFSYQD